jgi:hypothetical protein
MTDNDNAWQTGLIAGRSVAADADWNCDTLEEKRYAISNVLSDEKCVASPIIFEPRATSSFSADTKMVANQIIIPPVLTRCTGRSGYSGAAAACNSSAWYSACEYSSTDRACVRSPVWKAQQCR